MRRPVNPPIVGEGISANFGRSLCGEARANRIIAGQNIRLEYTPDGTVVHAPGGSKPYSGFTAVEPFTVRWRSHDRDGNSPSSGEWQIFLPFGCLTVRYGSASSVVRRYSALPTNEVGRDANGDEDYGWYRIPPPDDSNAFITESGEFIAKAWTVHILTKPWARFIATTDPGHDGYENVAWSDAVATIHEAELNDANGDTRIIHSATQSQSGGMTKDWNNSEPFAIDYELSDPYSVASGHTANLINQTKMLGRLQKENLDPVDVSEAEAVFVVIRHADANFDLEIATSVGDEVSGDDKTIYKIYDLKDGVVTKDYRSAIPELPFYTNEPDQS